MDTKLSADDYIGWGDSKEECKCENGKCEVECAEWKDGACLKTKQVCVCDPEFGKYDDHRCIYCDCGKGFNCTIDKESRGDTRICTCPEGYYDYAKECAPFCSKSRPCQNGGTCFNGRCQCMKSTHGPFCERIFHCAFECRPRLIVDCVYNQKDETFACLCKNRSLVFDYDEWVCKPCPCGEGICTFDWHELKCNCKEGFQEFQKQCRKCDCGPGHGCEILRSGEKQCKCREGFFAREGTCLPCECGHEQATCSLDQVNRKICNCPEGFEDNLGQCEKQKENCTCHATAKCIETADGFTCSCEDGYRGEFNDPPKPEEACIDIDECNNEATCPRSNNQKCINFPGSYMCQCGTGYQPVSGTGSGDRIICEEYKVSWLPTGITIGVIVAFIALSVGFVIFLRQKEASRHAPRFELRGTR
ncbi:Hemicentin-1 like protein [Argiope bruennichi]|uniref:Hemicentin-1 like protein n=1 Tax=Argiope bruennichi TaxID=94029 RepID=A0A8T0G120_ARGBR|nr:Hemicentin-1 like protein [Argiope bruennichi]